MTYDKSKALQLLKPLSEEYECTKDPVLEEKIILLVEKELVDCYTDYPREERRRIENKYGLLRYIMPSLVNKEIEKHPLRVYWELKEERKDARESNEAKRLEGLYSMDAKSPSQIKAEREAIEKRVFEAVKGDIGCLARSLSLADESLGNLILSRPIMDEYGTESVRSISNFLEDIAHKVLTIAQCNVKGEFTGDTITSGDEYVKYLSNRFVSKKMSNQEWSLVHLPRDQYEYMKNRSSRFGLLDEILTERMRQITKHGYSETHDDEHTDGSIADAAAHYASTKDDTGLWPWDAEYDKKSTKTRREQCMTSIAMLTAEVERMDRLEAAELGDK